MPGLYPFALCGFDAAGGFCVDPTVGTLTGCASCVDAKAGAIELLVNDETMTAVVATNENTVFSSLIQCTSLYEYERRTGDHFPKRY
jgi:hypothetical protein